MGKKYTPSGYVIIDLTVYGDLSDGDTINLGNTSDGKVIKEIINKGLTKPVLLKCISNSYTHLVVPTLCILDDNTVIITWIVYNEKYEFITDELIPDVDSMTLTINQLE